MGFANLRFVANSELGLLIFLRLRNLKQFNQELVSDKCLALNLLVNMGVDGFVTGLGTGVNKRQTKSGKDVRIGRSGGRKGKGRNGKVAEADLDEAAGVAAEGLAAAKSL